MDKSDIEGFSKQLTPKLKASAIPFSLFALKERYEHFAYATKITLQYAGIACLWLLLSELLLRIFTDSSAFSSGGNILFVAGSTLLIYLLLRRQTSIVEPAEVPMPDRPTQPKDDFEERADELSRLLTTSQGVNAKLEGLLADQTAIAIENERLQEEAGQIAILEERQRLGRDLHDSVTQALYSMMLFADATRLALAAGKQTEASENLFQVRKMARQAMADMRLLIYQLHPPLLKTEGLAAALQTRLDAVESRAGLQTEFRLVGDCNLLPAVEVEFYRIAQEALNNVIKHAKAEHVTIDLLCTEALCRMTISDDGIGFDVSTAAQNGGVGLRSIAERAKHIHARLTLESSPNQGTRVRVEV